MARVRSVSFLICLGGIACHKELPPTPPPTYIDLSVPHVSDAGLPEPESQPAVHKPDTPPLRHKPVAVEIFFRAANKKKKPHPFAGRYEVRDRNNRIVSDGPAPSSGEAVTLILSPDNYTILIPGTKFKQAMPLVYDEGDRRTVHVQIDKR